MKFYYTIERHTDDGIRPVITKAEITFAVAMLVADHASTHPINCQAHVIQYTDDPYDTPETVAVYESGTLIVLQGKVVVP